MFRSTDLGYAYPKQGEIMKVLWLCLLWSGFVFGKSIKDYDFYKYDVFFTNPSCKAYEYDETVYSNDGDALRAKPKNVYCKRGDKAANQKRKSSPHYNLRKLILNPEVHELFLTYLSFSNADIADALCETIEKNNTKVTFIIDKGNMRNPGKRARLDQVAACRAKGVEADKQNIPRIEFRGKNGGLGYAHNKLILAKYKNEPSKVTIVYSSGNMSSGTVLHHENWHFLTTSTQSYFAQAHECIKDGMLDHSNSIRANRSLGRASMSAINAFKKYITSCREAIKAKEESDIKLFIVPTDGAKAMKNIVTGIKKAKKIDVAVHRFTHPDLINAMKGAAKSKKPVRLVADDDIYWVGIQAKTASGRISCRGASNVGANMCSEYFKMRSVQRSGVDVKFMETNHNVFLLHHNKYIIFDYENEPDALHCGAGNFTQAAFSKNFENYYYITIPEVVQQFKKQYQYMYEKLASEEGSLPAVMTMP